ncbi:L-threonylcarbamoyladenylate synthase [Mycoplasma phocoenae]|uniref:L-threonylcarbamoyladenylate synthase n=1 Tax=Mycoplasma phocoenae TaxID=754517 RepID=A0A858U307_9MOLU|nr:Sua5/YciO/YrdC/YwlC family protein [Mycoplasma phocoenae]QJG66802.1 Sua5/YciO/YrdC/YwlC family protein [Mycoplasma phocoenae]
MMKNKFENIHVFTTDTVLGMGCSIKDKKSLELIYDLKQRDCSKKIIILLANIEQLYALENITNEQKNILNKYWPGAVSFIINQQGYRIPDNNSLRNFLLEKGPFYVTSCNVSGHPAIESIEIAKKEFTQLVNFNDFGPMSQDASAVIDLDNNVLLRASKIINKW